MLCAQSAFEYWNIKVVRTYNVWTYFGISVLTSYFGVKFVFISTVKQSYGLSQFVSLFVFRITPKLYFICYLLSYYKWHLVN